MDGKIYKVFVSSTYEDLREERSVVQKALLQLDCLPVGMELFPAADEETWKFIKSQIDDSDYYVVMIAGRYGSVAADGISYTEKEYDYALERKKPTIGFVHGQPGKIVSEHTERDPARQKKLDALLQKVKQRPVRTFTTSHELGLEVTTSFVKLIRDHPREVYVRSSEAVDYKRYAALLEENNALKERMKVTGADNHIFRGHDRSIKLSIRTWRHARPRNELQVIEVEKSLGDVFFLIAESILQTPTETDILQNVAYWLVEPLKDAQQIEGFDQASEALIRRLVQLYGLVEISRETTNSPDYLKGTSYSETVAVWRLTDYGRSQLRIIAEE